MKKYLRDLQLFAGEDEDLEDVEIEDTEEDVEIEDTEEEADKPETSEEETEETEEDDKEAEKPDKKPDKVTSALIKQKQENKALKDKLKTFEEAEAKRQRDEADTERKRKLIEEGYSEQEAEEKLADRRERDELKKKLMRLEYGTQADKLASRYPDIYEHLDSFITIVEGSKGAITLVELCKAKLDERSEKEIRSKAEQEALLARQKAKGKKMETGESKIEPPVKLDPGDQKILAGMNEKRKRAGKAPLKPKQYLEYLEG